MKKVFFIISLCCFTSLTALSQDALVEDGAFPEAEFDEAICSLLHLRQKNRINRIRRQT